MSYLPLDNDWNNVVLFIYFYILTPLFYSIISLLHLQVYNTSYGTIDDSGIYEKICQYLQTNGYSQVTIFMQNDCTVNYIPKFIVSSFTFFLFSALTYSIIMGLLVIILFFSLVEKYKSQQFLRLFENFAIIHRILLLGTFILWIGFMTFLKNYSDLYIVNIIIVMIIVMDFYLLKRVKIFNHIDFTNYAIQVQIKEITVS